MTKIDSAFRIRRSKLVWLLFAAATVFVYFFGLSIPLVGPDEPRYAQVAREMFERGDWVTPTLGGYHWFEKPALLYWLQIASYNIFGVTEFAARFGSAVFGLGTVASLWILGRVSEGVSLANCLGLIAASTIGLIVFSHGASFDIVVTFPLTAAMVGFFVFDLSERGGVRRSYGSWVLGGFYFLVGVSVLAKGLIGIVFPFAIAGSYYLLSWRLPSRRLWLSLLWGVPLALAVASTWYLAMYLRHGHEFIDEFFIQHHFQRYTSNKYLHPQPFYFFLWILPLMTIPWLPFFLAALWDLIRRFKRKDTDTRDRGHREWERGRQEVDTSFAEPIQVSASPGLLRVSTSHLVLFSLAWLTVPLVFFSFSGSKLPGYILPSVPPALIITAIYVSLYVRVSGRRKTLVQSLAIATFAVVVLLLAFVVPHYAEQDSTRSLFAVANVRGYGDARVLSMHTISHNAEFYGAGGIVRNADGKQRRFPGVSEVRDEIAKGGGAPVLVLVPLEYLSQLTESEDLKADVLGENGELAIAAVRLR